jgi:hypothetical protein
MRYGDLLPATEHLPGSEEKIRVMRQRARNGYSVFHPDDAASYRLAEIVDREKVRSRKSERPKRKRGGKNALG